MTTSLSRSLKKQVLMRFEGSKGSVADKNVAFPETSPLGPALPRFPQPFAMADTGRPAWMIGFWDGSSD